MSGEIQFIANSDDWKIVKKLRTDDAVPKIDIIDFIASISLSFDSKIEELLGTICDLKLVNKYIDDNVSGKTRKEDDLAKILKAMAGMNAGKVIKATIPEECDKKTKEKLKIYLKVIMTRKALIKAGLELDFSKAPIPANKKKKKA